tara:strand:- start:7022 stop:7615 length:594 start_codon:yes stop_codon:yes gene_type:complete
MKSLDLREVESHIINLDSQPDKLERVASRLTERGLSAARFSAIQHEQGVVGCALSHIELLSKVSAPVLILEDDVVPTEAWNPIIEVSDEVDAVYLGVSNWGYVRPHLDRSYYSTVIASQYDENYKRVYNMCSTHAILYLNDDIIKKTIDITQRAVDNNSPFDLWLAENQNKNIIITPNEPMVYQEDLPQFTNFTLNV